MDYIYTSFQTTFMGLKEMLAKKSRLDEVEKVEEAIQDMLVVMSKRELTEFGAGVGM